MLRDLITGILGGYFFDRLLKIIGPKPRSKYDRIPRHEMEARNKWVEYGGSFTLGTSFLLIVVWILNVGLANNAWRIGFLFCFPVLLTLLFVCVATLPRGLWRFGEFWRFHELRHGTRLALILSIYLPLAALGLASAILTFTR